MRLIELTSQFRRDYKRELKGPYRSALRDCRDCHVRPDLLLIYRKPDAVTLQWIRLGSHSEPGF
ncbi:type II toxin-antitoxin system mRNA interferase toxin, RelE/StbE family [Cupriavidus oxalaticus]|uniref:Type II toxin-antitoxin system mRNA interferase toxin, RelE/StbE family n=1 Tax=Cupriavidus oxalaticus TaxID=96344 RepID=A0A5P3VGE6_9BURK|nr:type II toxin-antitoxin system mRNA interferase toxin, RelE/StbE family [Cupriavidus oxalaticus]QEZ43969.1 type II toxin-antitoxin system mRNA interferase toxin, RelE/StbE family [Cupriavidus oxalaticus]